MPVNYDSIQADNEVEYGNIARWGPGLLANRYADRTQFIFEILQNAEDALKKRGVWPGSRQVNFSLDDQGLTISHFGKPFNEADVRGVCGIGEGTKGLTDIGRFGIGFKSVYASTDRPEIHSGYEHFAIDSYVFPWAIEQKDLKPEETKIYIPFQSGEKGAKEEILKGLRRLGPRTLLFLREINEISWSVPGGPSGLYLRNEPEDIGTGARKVALQGQDNTREDVEEWIVFSREVSNDGKSAGHVEVAFELEQDKEGSQNPSIRPVVDSLLVVFFPTVLTTHLGFLVQGPYRTTPSRDNVPQEDPWNRYLVQETAVLLVDALRELRELGLLHVSALQCLPLETSRFREDTRFAPLFEGVREALGTEPLLPAYNGGHIAGQDAKLARGRDLRTLIGPKQLANLFPSNDNLAWLSDEITAGQTPDLHSYITTKLDVEEITPEWLVPRLTKPFLEAQPDEWIERLYVFLSGQRALLQRGLREKPLVRLEDGSHTAAFIGEEPQAYLPGDTLTEFPTVKRRFCQSDKSCAFLESLGLRIPDPVDDVISNVLPKYRKAQVDIPDHEYQADIKRILAAYGTDSNAQQDNLLCALKQVKFVAAVDTGSGVTKFVRPVEAYLPTEQLKSLFEGIPGVLIVDDSRDCLKDEHICELLREVETPEYLVRTPIKTSLTCEYKRKLRGRIKIKGEESVEDHTLMGLDSLLSVLADLPNDQASDRAALLWEALCHTASRYGVQPRWNNANSVFYGCYRWYWYKKERSAVFPARFVRTLNKVAWVPSKNGTLQPPDAVVFKDTGWEEDSNLTAKIRFKRDALNQQGKIDTGLGFEPEALEILKKLGCTTVAAVNKLINRSDYASDTGIGGSSDYEDGALVNNDQRPITAAASDSGLAGAESNDHKKMLNSAGDAASSKPGSQRKFVSYVEVSPSEETEDPDSLSHEKRMDLEMQAIDLICSKEPTLRTTPTHNPGFDLTERNTEGNTVRWIEVKAMKGTLKDRPVTLTRRQFKFAQDHKNAYWLYIVEKVGDSSQSNIICIKDPAGKAKTFTFDHGWAAVAEVPN